MQSVAEKVTMKPRRRSRRVLLEIMYELDLAEHKPFVVLDRRLKEEYDEDRPDEKPLGEGSAEFVRLLLQGITIWQPRIDGFITRFAPEWPIEQIAVIDRNILRMAIYELLVAGETPVKVVINEAVELAKSYGSDSAPRFVNGVLGTLADQIEPLRLELGITPAAE
jgi:N utilization substance protein B